MKQWIKRITGIAAKEQALEEERARIAAEKAELEKQKAESLSPKERATQAKEPFIDILAIEVDADNPSFGSFELDWNEYFVKKLRSLGYPGADDETVVDLWFQSVCRNILMETYEQEVANRGDNVRYINRKDLGGGKTEVS